MLLNRLRLVNTLRPDSTCFGDSMTNEEWENSPYRYYDVIDFGLRIKKLRFLNPVVFINQYDGRAYRTSCLTQVNKSSVQKIEECQSTTVVTLKNNFVGWLEANHSLITDNELQSIMNSKYAQGKIW